MLFDEDEEIVAFGRKPKGFVEVDKGLKRSKLFLDVNSGSGVHFGWIDGINFPKLPVAPVSRSLAR